jgi:hypothetical protein
MVKFEIHENIIDDENISRTDAGGAKKSTQEKQPTALRVLPLCHHRLCGRFLLLPA